MIRRVIVLVAMLGCMGGRPPADASRAALRTPASAPTDPTLTPARLVPALSQASGGKVEDEITFGTEPGGAVRALVAGVRIINLAGGGVLSAADPLPAQPSGSSWMIEVPDRMGGGFLFAIGDKIFRADKWLAPLRPLYKFDGLTPTQLFLGLDRAYVRLSNHAYAAFDPKTGTPMDLGPWPASPVITRYAALDGWRAAAIADMRGLVATFDAGVRWQNIPLPIEPKELMRVGDTLVAMGTDSLGKPQSYALDSQGHIARLADEAAARKTTDVAPPEAPHPLGKRPLSAAVLDGWPLSDGTALVARDAMLARVRLADGVIVDVAPDAFPLKPARCHPLSLASTRAPAAFGFVCGEPHGATEIYAYDGVRGSLRLLKHFDTPRQVVSPANGTLAIEGSCDADANTNDGRGGEQHYCLMRPSGAFDDFVVNGDVGAERVVPLADGRTAIISPPAGDLAMARLTIFDGAHPKTIPLAFQLAGQPHPITDKKKTKEDDDDEEESSPEDHADDAEVLVAVLRSGTWLRGFEERQPGVLSGWVESRGMYVGIQIKVDGQAKAGHMVTDLGSAIVSGRYGLGWTASRQGYETIDGGMTWKTIPLPEPLEQAGLVGGATTHGCGPLGCVLAGWIRVGWGEATAPAASTYTAATPPTTPIDSPVSLSLRCELQTKLAAQGLDSAAVHEGSSSYYGYGGYYGRYGRSGYNSQSTRDWTAFYTAEAPKLGSDDVGFSVRVDDTFERSVLDRSQRMAIAPLARLYAWGPRGLEWDTKGKFFVRFSLPFESSSILRVTQPIPTPHYINEAFNFATGATPHILHDLDIITGDDATHALLVLRRNYSQPWDYVLVELEAERPATEVHRADGTALGEIESAVRMAGRWYVATAESVAERANPASIIWEVQNGLAREVVRVPRIWNDGSAGQRQPLRLAKRSDGRILGAMIEGSPMTEGAARPNRWPNQLWVLPIDVDAGTFGEPERLGPSDGGGKRTTVCAPQDGGWVVDGKWPGGTLSVTVGGSSERSSTSTLTRYRVTSTSLCLEKVSLAAHSEASDLKLGALGKVDGPFADVGLYSERARQSLRCVGNR